MTRSTSYPDGHWSLKVEIPYSMGVRQGDLIMLSGQADLKDMGEVCNADDLHAQTDTALGHIKNIFADLGSSLEALTKLTVFYVNNGGVDQSAYTRHIGEQLGTKNRPVIVFVPVRRMFYDGLLVEIDAVGVGSKALRRYVDDESCGPINPWFSQAMQCGEFIFVGGTTAAASDAPLSARPSIPPPTIGDSAAQTHTVLARIERLLGKFGASRTDIVKVNNWFVINGTAEDWAKSAEVRAAFYTEPGPAATGHPLHSLGTLGTLGATISTDCWAMLGADCIPLPKHHVWPNGHWDWPVHLPFKHGVGCQDFIFIGGQVSLDSSGGVIDPDQLAAQTRTAMENIGKVLAHFDATYEDIIKLNTWYQGARGGDADPDALHRSVNIRSSYFQRPGPASTGIPLDNLCFERMVTETEVVAYKKGNC
jgi:enamine deaminase RidA (YjgF/YER057c/UK114 family)